MDHMLNFNDFNLEVYIEVLSVDVHINWVNYLGKVYIILNYFVEGIVVSQDRFGVINKVISVINVVVDLNNHNSDDV